MSLRRIDSRFLLPHPVTRAAVLPGATGWHEELERAGIEVVPDRGDQLDLAVAPAERASEAHALDPAAVIVEGRRPRLPRGVSFLPLPAHDEPLVFVPLGNPAPARYAISQWAFADSAWKRARNRVLGTLAARDLFPPLRPLVTVSAPRQPPFLVQAAYENGVPAGALPLLLAGQGDDYSRGAFLLFEPGAAEPGWALKFGRLPVELGSFEREERGLRLAQAAGVVVSAHAPRHVGRWEAAGLSCALETAATGKPLQTLLQTAPDEGQRLTELVCSWLVGVATSTAEIGAALRPELERLDREVLPAWKLAPDAASRLSDVPGIFQHNDLGSWNILFSDERFTVLDWEGYVAHGLPFWDLWYFLADAAAHLDGVESQAGRPDHFQHLFLGEAASSPLLFRWTRRLAEALDVKPAAVGGIATLCWLHHGLAGDRRAAEASAGPVEPYVQHEVLRRNAQAWLEHPGLGWNWDRWR